MAILLAEYLAGKKLPRSVQISGSDIKEESVAFARLRTLTSATAK